MLPFCSSAVSAADESAAVEAAAAAPAAAAAIDAAQASLSLPILQTRHVQLKAPGAVQRRKNSSMLESMEMDH